MELSLLLLKKIVVLLSMVIMGFLTVKSGKLKSEESAVLSKISFEWLCPCCLISSFTTSYGDTVLRSFLFTCVAAGTMIVFYILLTLALRKALRLNPTEQGSLMFTNSATMGLPVASALLGQESVIYCAPHMGIQNLFIFTLLPYIMKGKSEGGIRKLLLNRNLVAIYIGFFLMVTGITLPGPVQDVIGTVGGTIGPVSMLMIGMMMGGVDFSKLVREKKIYLVILLRLIVYPFIAILLIRFSGIPVRFPYMKTPLLVLLLCFASPVATLIAQFSNLYRSPEESGESGSINVVTTLLCSVTMPFMVLVYQLICG